MRMTACGYSSPRATDRTLMAKELHVYQALWAMDKLASPEASTAEKFDRVRAAGFDGMTIDLGALTLAQAEATVP